MDNTAPTPSGNAKRTQPAVAVSQKDAGGFDAQNPSAVTVTIVGAGGCGINLSRPFLKKDGEAAPTPANVLYFDTSTTNTRFGEKAYTIANGSGSGSNRAENAADIERSIPQLSDEEIGKADVVIVQFALGGGSGSVIGPLLIREYAKRGTRVIAVAVADTSSSVSAKNTFNTLKTLTAICKNNNLYLPMILVSNDQADTRRSVNQEVHSMVTDLVDLLTKPVYEVDRNDRLNWVDPTKVVSAQPGLKLLAFSSDKAPSDTKIVLGSDSSEMVDALIVLQSEDDEIGKSSLPPARLKKIGFYYKSHRSIVGKVSSDIRSIDSVIDYVERMQHQDRSQKHELNDRLNTSGTDDLII